jgi:hypothetical protein
MMAIFERFLANLMNNAGNMTSPYWIWVFNRVAHQLADNFLVLFCARAGAEQAVGPRQIRFQSRLPEGKVLQPIL